MYTALHPISFALDGGGFRSGMMDGSGTIDPAALNHSGTAFNSSSHPVRPLGLYPTTLCASLHTLHPPHLSGTLGMR